MASSTSGIPIVTSDIFIEHFLKETISGVIILGAVGSIFAVAVLWLLRKFITRALPIPLLFHRKMTIKQAYMMGYSHSLISEDKSNIMIVSALFFHSCLLMFYTCGFFTSCIVFFISIFIKSSSFLTLYSFVSSASAFTLIYLAFFEFEYIYRTYLAWWKAPLEKAEKSYLEVKLNHSKR